MKYDYFAFTYNKHKSTLEEIIQDSEISKNVKFQELKAVWKEKKSIVKTINLNSICQEPIKTHLVFDKLKNGKDSSWKNVLTKFYKVKIGDLNQELSNELPKAFKKNYNFFSFIGRVFSLNLTLTSPFFTASENQFYSIQNPIAKERPTGLPVFKGSSFKGALRQAAIDVVEDELFNKNYGEILKEYASKSEEEIVEAEEKDRFFFKKREQLVKLFGNEKDVRWFTFKTLLATGGIKDFNKTEEILDKISNAFEYYLRKSKITDKEGNCKGRLVFEDIHFKKVTLDVITPLSREKRTPVHGPIFYEVVPEGEFATTSILWFPFDLIAEGSKNIDEEWEKDKSLIKNALNKLKEKGIGAKTKDGWGRFKWEEIS
jgi:CRISPR-associated protein Cmr2